MDKDEEYKLLLDHVKGLTDRRQSVSTTYLTVNAAVSAAIAFFFKDGRLTGTVDEGSALILLTAGIVASAFWRRLIKQYSDLIGWWYEHIRGLETNLPGSSGAITKEYDRWYLRRRSAVTVGMTKYEVGLTYIFTAVYGLFGLGIIMAIATTPA